MGLLSRRKSIFSYIPLIRWFGPTLTLAGVLAAGFMVVTGRIDLASLDFYRGDHPLVEIKPVELKDLGDKSPNTIRIATFNIQMFGDKKSSDHEVMTILAQVVTRFDVVAIQEILSGSVPADRLVDLINRSGGKFGLAISPPIRDDRTKSNHSESYAYIWDATQIAMVPESSYVVGDSGKRMHREPWVASFQTLAPPRDGYQPFSFTLINVHTDPDLVSSSSQHNELDVLDDVFTRVRQYEYNLTGQTDFILLGDLNVDTKNLSELGTIPNVESITRGQFTNTARTKTYDHIILDRTMTTEFTRNWGVLNLKQEMGLSDEVEKRVSDHLPVWAEFNAYAAPLPTQQNTSVAAQRGPTMIQ